MGRTLTAQQVADVIALELSAGDHIECAACGFGEGREVVSVIEHTMFDHANREDVIVVRSAILLHAYRLAQTLALDPVTEWEQNWREHNPLT